MKRLLLLSLLIPLFTVSVSRAQQVAGDTDTNENVVFDPVLFDDLEYRMIGPYRGGRSTAVTGIAGKPDTYFMGTTGGGVWKTTNSGQDWKNISDGHFDVASIGGIDVANSDPNVIYVGTGSACMRGNIQTGRGVYKSTDGGESWSFVGLEDAGLIGKVAVHPDDADIAYIAAVGHPFGHNEQRGVFRTTDGGDTWEKVLYISDSTGVVDLALNPKNPREIYAGLWTAERKPWTMISGSKEGGIYKSTDGGDNWKRLKGGLPRGIVGKTSVTVSPAKPERVWALIEAPEPKGGLYRSDDHGKTWKQVNDNRNHLQRSWYYTHIYADPKDENTVYSLNVGFYKSVDGGKTFEQYGVPHGDVHDLWLNPQEPDRMVVANDGGAQVSVDGAETWSTYYNQPTAEMYSVTVDNEFPYRVYGPQQDNSTIRLPAWSEGVIHPKRNWTYVGGCETGPVALHPDRPWLVYSGCYGGSITRWNEKTGQSRNVMVYPQLQLGQAPKTLRERFQWNAPIVVSPYDQNVVYHASQHIWRSTDRGMTWERISGDLTTDTPAHQDFAGEPITKDNTGVEVFNTVFSLRISPHSSETLWAGTDDGLVWISRDNGSNWNDITPDDLPQYGTVQRIEVSPHEAGKAYVAVHHYRLDDWQPYIYRTTDFGQSWTRIADGSRGIPDDSPTWVVREDPKREGLLYAGTEFGIYVSFDDGDNWQSLQQNLPVTRIPDLKVHDNDLVVATHGRSFWIMDDLSPLHQLTGRVANSGMRLHSPEAAYLVNPRGGGDPEDRQPEGPAGGAAFDYIFTEIPDTTVTLEVLNTEGRVLRSFTTDSAQAKENSEPVLPVDSTHTRFHWNLRTSGVDKVEDAILWGYTGGVKPVPGNYQVRLSVEGGPAQTRSFEVRKDPRLKDVTNQDFQERYNLAMAIRDSLNSIYDALRTIRSVREQVNSLVSNAKEAGHDVSEIQSLADTITSKMSSLEGKLMQVKHQSFQDPLNFPPQLDNQYAYLYGYVNGAAPPTVGAHERFSDLNEQWNVLRNRLENVINSEVENFNLHIRELEKHVFIPE
jgi:photosystem II stability/assembly factor-like uncharacterized protein